MPLLHVVVAAAVAFSAPPSMVHHAVVSAAPTAHAPQRALLAQTLCRAPQVSPAARVSTPVEMSTKYTVAAGLTKKKKATPTLGENCGLPPCLQATHSLYLHALMSRANTGAHTQEQAIVRKNETLISFTPRGSWLQGWPARSRHRGCIRDDEERAVTVGQDLGWQEEVSRYLDCFDHGMGALRTLFAGGGGTRCICATLPSVHKSRCSFVRMY